MLATTLIVFREVLEAALVVGIVLAATRGVVGRGRWVFGGVVAGVLAAGVIAVFAEAIAAAAAGMGQELFNAGVLLIAVCMLGWHNVWMGRHGREMAAEMDAVGRAVMAGTRPLYALAAVVGIAVLREGAEVVLFLYGIAAAGESGAGMMLAGGVLGLAAGAAAGLALYLGLVSIPLRHLFTVTSWLILALAAGMAAQAAAFLVQAGLLPTLGAGIWDTSAILAEDGPVGRVLHALIGYVARPDGIQVVFYVATLVIIGGLMRLVGRSTRAVSGRRADAVARPTI